MEIKIVIMYDYFNFYNLLKKKVIIIRIFLLFKSWVDFIYFFIENSFKLEIWKLINWVYLKKKKKNYEKYGVFRNMRNLIFLCGCLMDFNLNKSMSWIYFYFYWLLWKYWYFIKGFCLFFKVVL